MKTPYEIHKGKLLLKTNGKPYTSYQAIVRIIQKWDVQKKDGAYQVPDELITTHNLLMKQVAEITK